MTWRLASPCWRLGRLVIRRPHLYEDEAVALLVLAAANVALTWNLWQRFNWGDIWLQTFTASVGPTGLFAYQLLLAMLLAIVAEDVGRRRPRTGRRILRAGIFVSSVAMAAALVQLGMELI